jgi:hypothetical protein
MLLRDPKTEKFDQDIGRVAIKITNKALQLNGSYYLPYRPYQARCTSQDLILQTL